MEQRERWRAGNPWLNELLEEEEGKNWRGEERVNQEGLFG